VWWARVYDFYFFFSISPFAPSVMLGQLLAASVILSPDAVREINTVSLQPGVPPRCCAYAVRHLWYLTPDDGDDRVTADRVVRGLVREAVAHKSVYELMRWAVTRARVLKGLPALPELDFHRAPTNLDSADAFAAFFQSMVSEVPGAAPSVIVRAPAVVATVM